MRRPRPAVLLAAGFAVFVFLGISFMLARAALGPRWSYRVLVLPGEPLVSSGPYAYLRHPNYLAVVGEIAGFALIVGARFAGVLSLVVFGLLMRKRIKIEENAILTHTQ